MGSRSWVKKSTYQERIIKIIKATAAAKKVNKSGSRSGWGEAEDDGGWSQGPPATGSGWTELECAAASENGDEIGTWQNPSESNWSAQNNEIIVDSRDKEAWPSIGDNSETTSESGEADNSSVKSGSVISSSSNHGPNLDVSQGSGAIHGQSASSIWSTTNSTGQGSDSNVWGIGSTSSPSTSMNSLDWGSFSPNAPVNNPGHNMQPSGSSSGSDSAQEFTNSSSFSTGWGVSAAQGSAPMSQYSMQMSSSGNKDKLQGFLPNGGAQMDKLNGPVFGGDQLGSVLQGINNVSSGLSKLSTGQESGLSNNRPPVSLGSSIGQPINGASKSGNNSSQWGAQTNPIGWASSSANGNGRPSAGGWSNPNSGTSPNPAAGEWGTGDKPNSQWNSSPWGNSPGAGSSLGVTTLSATNTNAPPKPTNTWAQAAGKGLNLNSISTTSTTPSIESSNKTPSVSSASQVLDPQEQEIQNAIDSNDGWGQTPVRQDTNWETNTQTIFKQKYAPTSSEPTPQPSNVWNNNNGTAIWEAMKSSKPVGWQPAPANPSSMGSGSQWGNSDRPESAAWAGSQVNQSSGDSSPGPWSANSEKSMGTWGGNSAQSADWGRTKQDSSGSWAGSNGDPRTRNSASSWGDGGNIENPVNWDGQQGNRRSGEEVGANYWGEPPNQPNRPPPPPANWNVPPTPITPHTPHTPLPKPEEDMWSKPANKLPPTTPSQPSGWGDPSPPSTKVDDGTSIWAANNQRQARAGGWGDTGWTSNGAKPKMSSSSWAEQDNGMTWNEGRKGSESWTPDDNGGESGWDTDMGNWEGSQETNPSWTSAPGFKKRQPSIKGTSFPRGPNQAPQMRIKLLQQLMDMGFKKDETQHALINNNMSFEHALADLKGGATFDRKDQDMDVFSMLDGAKPRQLRPELGHPINDDISDTQLDANPYVPTISMQNTPFPNAQVPNQHVYASPLKPGPSLNPSSLNASNPSINASLQQKLLQQKLLNQQSPIPPPQQPLNTMNSTQVPPVRGQIPPQALPAQQQQQQNNQQQMLQQQIVKQLRMAIQAGLISHRLFDYHLPPTTLLQLQQLLQLQNFLTQLVIKQQAIQQNNMGMSHQSQRQQHEQTSLTINRIRQQMTQLQQQLAQVEVMGKQVNVSDSPDPSLLAGLQEIGGLNPGTPPAQLQSRLTQWKIPEKQMDSPGEGLNKAVGSKPLHSSSSLGKFESLNIGGDSTWSSVSTSSTHNWPTLSSVPAGTSHADGSKMTGNKESQSGNVSPITTSNSNMLSLDNIIHEFVPGKPWQGMTKNVEDDPHITPGSFSRSLSVNTIKDEYLSNLAALTKTSSQVGSDQQLSSQLTSQPSSTWSVKDFPRSATGANQALSSSKLWNPGDSVTPTSLTSELWGAPYQKSSAAPARPPPGLSHQAKSGWGSAPIHRQQSWAGSTAGSAFTQVGNSSSWESRSPNVSVWLMLRNLTPQIDGSTLKTLCQQHGPLHFFYLNHGQALVRYSKGEEAIKAQKSLNTCVLGNTTILAEFVSDTEVARFMQESSAVNASTASQWSQSSTTNYRSTAANYSNRSSAPDVSSWNHAPAAAAGPPQPSTTAFSSPFPGGNSSMWGGGNMWGVNMPIEEHTSTPLLGGLLSGESM